MASVKEAPTQEGGTSMAFVTLIEDGLCDVVAFVVRRIPHGIGVGRAVTHS